jgi:hypothetical protein
MQLDSSFMRCATVRWQASPQNIELALGAIMRASENGLGQPTINWPAAATSR